MFVFVFIPNFECGIANHNNNKFTIGMTTVAGYLLRQMAFKRIKLLTVLLS